MRRSVWILAPLVLVAAGGAAAAEDEGPWDGKVTLGYLATSGNSDSLSVNAGAEVGYTTGRWRHLAEASAVGAQQEEETTAEAYKAVWNSEYSFSETDYLFGRVRWQKDKFSGYDQQVTESIGYGRRILDNERHTLNAEVGAGARQSDLRDGSSEEEMILRGALDYTWQISETAEFSQDFSVESGSENTFMESVSEIKASLVGDLALVASYTVRRNTTVPAGSEKTDTFTALSLEYAF